MIDPQARRLWLRLVLTPGIGPVQARQAHALADPSTPVGSPGWLNRLATLQARLAERLSQRDPAREALIEEVLAWADLPGQHLLSWGDPDYPTRLTDLHDPPPLVFARGRLDALDAPGLAIVGSRHATTGGARHARAFARHMAALGWAVVSGLARGIDAAAHEGALEAVDAHGRPGRTLAVLGNGADGIYPPGHAGLAARILERGGLILGELPPGCPPLRAHFPRRNRLIAALSQGVLVVEAARGSGSLITAQWAVDLGREVFAIPGSIDAPQSRGCHHLIRQGACLVESAADLIDELPALCARPLSDSDNPSAPSMASNGTVVITDSEIGTLPEARRGPDPRADEAHPVRATDVGLAEQDQTLLRHLGWDPFRAETLAEDARLTAAELGAGLLRLELAGALERLTDGRYQRLRSGA